MKKLIRDNVLRIEQYEPGKPIELLRRELGPRLLGELPYGAESTVPPVHPRDLLAPPATW